MRYIGILLMSGAAVMAGFHTADRWKKRLELLILLRQMIYHLKNQIMYSNASLSEALSEVGRRFSEDRMDEFSEAGKFFLRTAERLEEEAGSSFRKVWREESERIPESVPLDKNDRKHLQEIGDHLGYADRTMQERTLLFYLERTDDTIEELKRETKDQTKLCRCLGLAAGLFIMVILI